MLVARDDDDFTVRISLDVTVDHLHRLHLDFRVGLNLLNSTIPTAREAVETLADTGMEEIAVVFMDPVSATGHSPVLTHARDEVGAANPGLNIVIIRPISPDIDLLSILGIKLREALRRANVVEVDALVLVCPDGGGLKGSSLLARRARQWSTHHRFPVQLAQNDTTGHVTALTINALHGQGRCHIAVGSLFLTPGPVLRAHQQAVIRAGTLATALPITENPRATELIPTRYIFTAMRLFDIDPHEDGT